jgi:hypothetical protein
MADISGVKLMQFSAMYIANYMQDDVRLGRAGTRGPVTEVTWIKNKKPRFSSRLPLAHTLPQVLRQNFPQESLLHDGERLAAGRAVHGSALSAGQLVTDHAIFCRAEIADTREVKCNRSGTSDK